MISAGAAPAPSYIKMGPDARGIMNNRCVLAFRLVLQEVRYAHLRIPLREVRRSLRAI